MFLTGFLFALALCSVRGEDIDCEEHLQRQDDLLSGGKWIVQALASTDPKASQQAKELQSIWMKITCTNNDAKMNIRRVDKLDNTCTTISGCLTPTEDGAVFRFETKPFYTTHTGKFLKTFDDNAAVFYGKTKCRQSKETSETLLLFALTEEVSETTMLRFKEQAACLSFKPDAIHVLDAKDLCDDHEDED